MRKSILASALISCTVIAIYFAFFHVTGRQLDQSKCPKKVVLALGETGEQWQKKYNAIVHVAEQPAGLRFYKMQPLRSKASVAVKLELQGHSLEISHVLSLTGTQDRGRGLSRRNEGIDSIQLSAAMSSQPLMEHDAARRYVWRLVKSIRAAGWQKYIEETDPRLSGKAAYEYAVQKHGALDPDYELSLTEWMTMPARTRWSFYAKDAFLSLEFDRDMQRMAPAKPGAYLLNVSISSAEQQFSSNFEFEERDHWRSLWDAAARKWKQERNIKEAKLRALGVVIDEGYQDPPLPAEPVGKQGWP
ncbi:hypothetical protein ACUXVY_19710 [Chromobacterium haemolyticum]|uniref:hypothetical protein n=1 Tax=Chromobacterium haemolyticum TaxID=394935 RepID=UPI0040579EDB